MAESRSLLHPEPARPAIATCGWWKLPAVYRIHTAVFPAPYSFARFVGYQLHSASRILITAPGPPVGYLIAAVNWLGFPGQPVGEIISLGVLAAHRRQGHGPALLRNALTWLKSRSVTRIQLQVAAHNDTAQHLYEGFGFRPRDWLPGYYINGDDAWLMELAVT